MRRGEKISRFPTNRKFLRLVFIQNRNLMNESWLSRIAQSIDVELRRKPGLSPVNKVIATVIVLSTLLVILETEPTIYEPYARWFYRAELGMLVFFTTEYLVRFWISQENPRYSKRFSFVFSPVALLDLVVIATMLLSFVGFQGSLLRLLRLIRLLRLAKLGKYSKALQNITAAVAERKFELLVRVFIAFGLLLLSASALYLVEGDLQPDAYGSIPRAMWWAMATLTTVGYGDAIPITPIGKLFASLTAFTGIGLIAIPTGILASAFSAAMQKPKNTIEKQGGNEGN